jgi:hypothetical protein
LRLGRAKITFPSVFQKVGALWKALGGMHMGPLDV